MGRDWETEDQVFDTTVGQLVGSYFAPRFLASVYTALAAANSSRMRLKDEDPGEKLACEAAVEEKELPTPSSFLPTALT